MLTPFPNIIISSSEVELHRRTDCLLPPLNLWPFCFIWAQKAPGQPDSLECSLAGKACVVTFNRLRGGGFLGADSAFYKVPQSQAVHKQVGIIIKYDYKTLIHPKSDSHSCSSIIQARQVTPSRLCSKSRHPFSSIYISVFWYGTDFKNDAAPWR